jgi:hypothetical protein
MLAGNHVAMTTLIDELHGIRHDMLALVEESSDLLEDIHPQHVASTRNLLHYLALRGRAPRPLHARLSEAGLSSLGRADSHVLAAVETVLSVLLRLSGQGAVEESRGRVDINAGQHLLDSHTEAALGAKRVRCSASCTSCRSSRPRTRRVGYRPHQGRAASRVRRLSPRLQRFIVGVVWLIVLVGRRHDGDPVGSGDPDSNR